jgi:hypothetical protein
MVIALVVVGSWIFGSLPLNLYDVSFSLDWGRDLLHGLIPDVRVQGASTPHPLSIATGALAALFGAGGLDAIRVGLLMSAGVAGLAVYQLGRASFSAAAGVVAMVALFISEPFLNSTLAWATPSDLPSLAALLGAIAFMVARPKSPLPPLALLAVAGLWRPEPWLLAVLYWVFATRGLPRRRRALLGLLAVSAPLLWTLGDLAMTGDPLYSLIYTHAATEVMQRPTGLGNVPSATYEVLRGYLGTAVLIGGTIGLLIDLRLRRLPRLLLWLLLLTTAEFVVLGAAHLPLDSRYMLAPTALLAVYFGYFLTGWTRERRGALWGAWVAGAAVISVFFGIWAVGNVRQLTGDRDSYRQYSAIIADLEKLARTPGVKQQLRSCGPIQASWRIVPILAYDIGVRPRQLTPNNDGIPGSGALVLPNGATAAQLFETHSFQPASLDRRGYHLLAINGSWKIYTTCS